jgi:hypothetical protein
MTQLTPATTMPPIPPTMTNLTGLLRATREIEQPHGAIIFTMLTTLVRSHELVRPTTTVRSGMLCVADPHPSEGLARGRIVPLPRAVRQVLVRDTGSLAWCLGVPKALVGGLNAELRRVLADLEGETGSLEQLWPLAVHGAMAAAISAHDRAAVLAFSGIHQTGKRAGAKRATLSDQDLQTVADLLDELVVAAGFDLEDVAQSTAVKSA